MRVNEPVTNREYVLKEDDTLLSSTDTHSHISYANPAFIQASGFSREELQGQPHNIVRHPDMPPEAFADMWRTLKEGFPWTALVKNRRSNGDHYWVRANATPMIRDGKVTGFLSVRTKPTKQEIGDAENLYKDFREGRAGQRRFNRGLVVRTGLYSPLSLLQRLSTTWRTRLAALIAPLVVAITAVMAGLDGSITVFLLAGAGTAAVLSVLWLEWQVVKPLDIVAKQARLVASGARTENPRLQRVDDLGLLLRSINQAGLNLRALVDDVNAQVAGISTATIQIRTGNDDLSSRTEASAASIEETAAAMEQLTATIAHNADAARKASSLASDTRDAASQGGRVVGEVIESMAGISDSSSQIKSIIGVIDSIAFQTNILALNASVEAARAGEQGRGFAVVAGEVRTLAGRCADAAREIKTLIEASGANVEAGVNLARQAGNEMNDIITRIQQVADLISEISAACAEQSRGAEQIGEAISQLDQATQQNAALVTESAAATASLTGQVERLAEALAVYRVADAGQSR